MITDSEDRSMIAELEQIIQAEEAKPEAERNADLIDECIREIAELKGVKADFSDEEVKEITDKLIKKIDREKRKKRLVRYVAGIAAMFVLVGGITACTINPALINWFIKIAHMPFGNIVEQEKITFICQGIPEEYENVDQLLKSQNLNIYYPVYLPTNVQLKSIEIVDLNGSKTALFVFSDSDLHFTVQFGQTDTMNRDTITSVVEANGLSFDIFENNESCWANCSADGNTYIIQSNSLDNIILIISGLRKG